MITFQSKLKIFFPEKRMLFSCSTGKPLPHLVLGHRDCSSALGSGIERGATNLESAEVVHT
jgi:hypothetical protein